MYYRNKNPLNFKDYDPKKNYKASELEEFADSLLREDSRTEVCRECDEGGVSGVRGEETGEQAVLAQTAEDESGTQLVLYFPEYACKNGHRWYKGEGKVRGIDGDNPILFEEHFQSRKRREIYTTVGTPDPSIVAGIYNRVHPQGRKVNSEEQRKKNGASFYR
jgi:hypothetical protein